MKLKQLCREEFFPLLAKIHPYNLANLNGQFISRSIYSSRLHSPRASSQKENKAAPQPCAQKKEGEKKSALPRWFDFYVRVATATSTTKPHRESKFLSLSFIWMCLRSLQGISIGKERCATEGNGERRSSRLIWRASCNTERNKLQFEPE